MKGTMVRCILRSKGRGPFRETLSYFAFFGHTEFSGFSPRVCWHTKSHRGKRRTTYPTPSDPCKGCHGDATERLTGTRCISVPGAMALAKTHVRCSRAMLVRTEGKPIWHEDGWILAGYVLPACRHSTIQHICWITSRSTSPGAFTCY